jgi:hypothetical protein
MNTEEMNYRNENNYKNNSNDYSDNNGDYVDLYSHFSKRASWMGKLAFKNYAKLRIHCEVQDFLEYIKSQNIDYQIRYRAIAELKLMIKIKF